MPKDNTPTKREIIDQYIAQYMDGLFQKYMDTKHTGKVVLTVDFFQGHPQNVKANLEEYVYPVSRVVAP